MRQSIGIQLNTEVWREGEMYIAYVQSLDLSSCGQTIEEAKKNIREATGAFLEETEKLGTLQMVLEEAGFSFNKETWQAPEIISFEKVNLVF